MCFFFFFFKVVERELGKKKKKLNAPGKLKKFKKILVAGEVFKAIFRPAPGLKDSNL